MSTLQLPNVHAQTTAEVPCKARARTAASRNSVVTCASDTLSTPFFAHTYALACVQIPKAAHGVEVDAVESSPPMTEGSASASGSSTVIGVHTGNGEGGGAENVQESAGQLISCGAPSGSCASGVHAPSSQSSSMPSSLVSDPPVYAARTH
jgi:hypothetical protein